MTEAALPIPSFIDRDPEAITREMITRYEAMAGRTLQPAQVERLMIDLVAYEEMLLRVAIQETALQNFLPWARYPTLDYIGEIWGVERLPASGAAVRLRFTLSGTQSQPVIIPAGTAVESTDREVRVQTVETLTILAGRVSGEVRAVATVPGAAGNGYLPGTLAALTSPIPLVASVANITTSLGGAEVENDERLRQRIREAPEALSVAGSRGAYRAHAMGAHADVVDVAVDSPRPGMVRLTVLANGGLPSQAILDVVSAAVSAETVRPLTDTVSVVPPTRVAYSIHARLTPLGSTDAASVIERAHAAAVAYAADRRMGLGRDLVVSQIIAALSLPGVYQVDLLTPANRILTETEFADCTASTLEILEPVHG